MKTVAITRPEDKIEESIEIVNAYGLDALAAPMIEVVGMRDKEFWVFFDHVMENEVDYVVFTSSNGVKFMMEGVDDDFVDHLNYSRVIAIGEMTKRALTEYNIHVDIVPDLFSSEGIVAEMEKRRIHGKLVEIIRSKDGRRFLIDGLRGLGAEVHEAHLYTVEIPKKLDKQRKLIESCLNGDVDIFTFTSGMIVSNFISIAAGMGVEGEVKKVMKEKIVAAIGSYTESELKKNGVSTDVIPEECTFEAMIARLT
jgi:uroporphyrinogen-III synthase